MRVSKVCVGFYGAFNFDYLRKHHPNAVPDPWDTNEGLFYGAAVMIATSNQCRSPAGCSQALHGPLEVRAVHDACHQDRGLTVPSDQRGLIDRLYLTGLTATMTLWVRALQPPNSLRGQLASTSVSCASSSAIMARRRSILRMLDAARRCSPLRVKLGLTTWDRSTTRTVREQHLGV